MLGLHFNMLNLPRLFQGSNFFGYRSSEEYLPRLGIYHSSSSCSCGLWSIHFVEQWRCPR